jgi:hypothetical protein
VDLQTGVPLGALTAADSVKVALAYADRGRAVPDAELIVRDQWTVAGSFDRNRPLYRVSLNDASGTQVYVSSRTGAAVQLTTSAQRFWNYLGAVPHWLYFTQLRQNVPLWSQIVIWSALAGILLVLTGLYTGLRHLFRARSAGHWSFYRGMALWHHVPGLVFGILLLSWTASGFLSMNPWGVLEGSSAQRENARLAGGPVPASAIAGLLSDLSRKNTSVVAIRSVPLNGKLYVAVTQSSGARSRLDAKAQPARFEDDLPFVAARLGTERGELLAAGDNYYFHHGDVSAALPAYRFLRQDGTRYYVDASSGELVAKLDDNSRLYRWLQQGPHRLDFSTLLRTRPLWDIVMLVLLLGATMTAGTGLYLAAAYLFRRD